jgi:hypothetical protein
MSPFGCLLFGHESWSSDSSFTAFFLSIVHSAYDRIAYGLYLAINYFQNPKPHTTQLLPLAFEPGCLQSYREEWLP